MQPEKLNLMLQLFCFMTFYHLMTDLHQCIGGNREDNTHLTTCFTRNSENTLGMENAFYFFQPDTRRFKQDQMKVIILVCLK